MYSAQIVQSAIKSLTTKIQSASDIKEIIPSLMEDIKELINCEAVSLFSLDRAKRQLVSRNFISDSVPELQIDISAKSAAGYVAMMGKSILINDAYSKQELSTYHSDLEFGSSRDAKTNFKTKSIIVVPLPYNKKLVGVMEFINKSDGNGFTQDDLKIARELSQTLGLLLSKLEENSSDFKSINDEANLDSKIHSIVHAIHCATSLDEILLVQKDAIVEMFDAGMITIYAVASMTNEIFSKVKSGDGVSEIRVPIAHNSIAGCIAMEQRLVNIKDVYDPSELKAYHPEMTFDSSWDKKTGTRTKSMLVCPMMHANRLMGILQLINKKSADRFTEADEKYAMTMSETLALAFSNQGKFVQPKPTKFSYLINNGLITEDELTASIAKARKHQFDIETILLTDLALKRPDIGKSLELFYNIPYFGYSNSTILQQQIFAGLNKNFLLKNYWLPIQMEDTKITILINDPNNPDKIQNIKLIFPKKQLEFKIGLKVDIIDFLNSTIAGDEEPIGDETKSEEISSLLTALKSEKDDGATVESPENDEVSAISENDSTIVRLVNKVLTDAYDEGVSDIHIEPGVGKENIMIRFRKDGDCRVYQEIPYIYKQAVLSRMKIMAKLDIAERRMPQDGKIKMKYKQKEIEYRVATCPTVGGNEDAVLRILAASKPLPLDKMNFSPRNLQLTKVSADKPYGLVLVVGPTGSGKTTTLHSVLGNINTPDQKIWTAEDPVEITQKGLRQVQMHPKIGLNFSRAMRSFLRCDPDVIMVGEMRDKETCEIGLEASLTGHLVFSTLHTNSAPETITRLLDMGMNPLNFADALILILAQRLVRTLCKNCKADFHPTREEFDVLVKEYGEEHFLKLGIKYEDALMKKAVGCDKCGNTGYAGRTGLHELLEGTDIMKRMIMKRSLVEDLRAQAITDGMTTLKQDGIYKVLKGDTDLKQVMAVCIV